MEVSKIVETLNSTDQAAFLSKFRELTPVIVASFTARDRSTPSENADMTKLFLTCCHYGDKDLIKDLLSTNRELLFSRNDDISPLKAAKNGKNIDVMGYLFEQSNKQLLTECQNRNLQRAQYLVTTYGASPILTHEEASHRSAGSFIEEFYGVEEALKFYKIQPEFYSPPQATRSEIATPKSTVAITQCSHFTPQTSTLTTPFK